MEWFIILVCIIVFLIMCIIVWYIGTQNLFKKLNIKVDEAESAIDVCLTQRYDLLTKLLSATKAYLKHEDDVLKSIVLARKISPGASMEQKCEFSNNIYVCNSKLGVVIENYPDLKSNTVILNLQRQSANVEEQIQASRMTYNDNVRYYNQKIITFPASIIANSKGYKKRSFFEASQNSRENINFNL